MATLMCVGAGLCAALGAWTLAGADGAARPSARRGAALWCLVGRLRGFAGTRAMTVLGSLGPCRRLADELARVPRLARLGVDRECALALAILWPGACGLAGLLVSLSVVGLLAGAVAGAAGALGWCAGREAARRRELARQVPDVFRSLAGALAAGRTLTQAISYVGSLGDGPLNREFARASLAVSCGEPATEAVERVARRTDAPGVELMACALSVSSRTGAPLQGLFLRSARFAERRFELERELASKTAQVRLSARIVSGLPVCLVAALALVSPDFRAGLATPAGLGCVVVAACLDVAALAIIRRLMRSVL